MGLIQQLNETGAKTGHAVATCDVCGMFMLTHFRPSGKNWPKCRLTTKCKGRMIMPPEDVVRLKAAKAPPRPTIPRVPKVHRPDPYILGPMPDPWTFSTARSAAGELPSSGVTIRLETDD